MSTYKDICLTGVAADVQLGRRGGRIIFDPGTGDVQFFEADGSTLTNLDVLDPTDPTHVTTKAYVDAKDFGARDPKDMVRAGSVGAMGFTASGSGVGKTLTAPTDATSHNTQDGILLAVGDRFLNKDDGVDSGIYDVTILGNGAGASFVLTRALDFDEDAEVTQGAYTGIVEGTVNQGRFYMVTTGDPITVDTTSIVWLLFSQIQTVDPLFRRVVLGTGATQPVGTPLPVGARLKRAFVEITTAYSASALIRLQDDNGSPFILIDDLESDAEDSPSEWRCPVPYVVPGGTRQINAIITGSPGAGAGIAVVEYVLA